MSGPSSHERGYDMMGFDMFLRYPGGDVEDALGRHFRCGCQQAVKSASILCVFEIDRWQCFPESESEEEAED